MYNEDEMYSSEELDRIGVKLINSFGSRTIYTLDNNVLDKKSFEKRLEKECKNNFYEVKEIINMYDGFRVRVLNSAEDEKYMTIRISNDEDENLFSFDVLSAPGMCTAQGDVCSAVTFATYDETILPLSFFANESGELPPRQSFYYAVSKISGKDNMELMEYDKFAAFDYLNQVIRDFIEEKMNEEEYINVRELERAYFEIENIIISSESIDDICISVDLSSVSVSIGEEEYFIRDIFSDIEGYHDSMKDFSIEIKYLVNMMGILSYSLNQFRSKENRKLRTGDVFDFIPDSLVSICDQKS